MLIVETDSLHPGGNHHEHKLYRAITFFGACGLYLGYIKAPLLALKITNSLPVEFFTLKDLYVFKENTHR